MGTSQLIAESTPQARLRAPLRKVGPFVRFYQLLSRLGRRQTLCCLAIFIFTIVFRLALTATLPHPQPSAHDEFAYLLGADMFAHGHLALPPHPYWKFFEQVHVLSQPVWVPKYPPAQSAFLALGQVFFGDPFYGVLLSVALFAAATCWMLQIYVGRGWALLGGFATALYFGAGHYWTESYWGGAVAGLGTAVLIGAFGRIRLYRKLPAAVLLGAGALLLITTRPYESSILIVVICLTLVLDFWKMDFWKMDVWKSRGSVSFALPLTAFMSLAAALAALLSYHYFVTGNPLQMPYSLHRAQYSSSPPFWFQQPYAPKTYTNLAIGAPFEQIERANFDEIRPLSPAGKIGRNIFTVFLTGGFGGGALGLLLLLFLPLLLRDPMVRYFAVCAVLLLALIVLEPGILLHYLTPLLIVGILLLFMIVDRLWKFRKTRSSDRVILVCVLTAFLLSGPLWRAGNALRGVPGDMYRGDHFGDQRAGIVKKMLALPGEHVIFVRYTAQQNPMHAWVANLSSPDTSRLVWAHDRGKENHLLQEYFKGRRFWLLEEHNGQADIVPYACGDCKQSWLVTNPGDRDSKREPGQRLP